MYKQEDNCSCLECGKEIYGRPDKKFCSEVCKNSFHNRKYYDYKKKQNSTITSLNRNHEILVSLIRMGKTTINLLDLTDLGFNPRYITGCSKVRSRHFENRCYDIAYYISETKIFNIHRIEL